jgi:DNA-binding transcriptional ArsR family regulator
MNDDDRVFKALADPTRRFLLDQLFARDGRTLTELESELEMTRFGVMKHLRVLEDAGLVVTRRQGREKLHFLNPVPIRLIHEWWIDSTGASGLGTRRPEARLEGDGRLLLRRLSHYGAPRVDQCCAATGLGRDHPTGWTERYGWPRAAGVRPRPGGKMTASRTRAEGIHAPDIVAAGEVLELDPPHGWSRPGACLDPTRRPSR